MAVIFCFLGIIVLYWALYEIGKSNDRKHQQKNRGASFTMRVKRTKQAGPIPLMLICFASSAGAWYFSKDDVLESVNAVVTLFAIIGLLFGLGLAIYILKMSLWKVVVIEDEFEVFGLFKKKTKYSFSDIYIVNVTAKMVAYSIERRIVPVYDVFVGGSDALKKKAFSMYENVISHDLFLRKVEVIGKVRNMD